MTSVLFIRHTSHTLLAKKILGRTPGIHLSDSGKREAEQIAEKLAVLPIDAVYSGPLERARESAEPLARRLHLQLQVADEFDELDMGEWSNRTLVELDLLPDWHRWNIRRSETTPPNGESMQQVQDRVLGKIAELRDQFGCIAIFTHGDVVRAAVTHFLGMRLDLLFRFQIDPGSVSLVHMHEAGAIVRMLNWVRIESVIG